MQPQKRGLEQRRPVRESRPAGPRQTPPKRAGQQRDAPMESPDDGPDWWRAKLRALLQRSNERGFGAGMLNSVLEEMMALDGVSRGGARDVPTSAPSEMADDANMCDDDDVVSDAEARVATECDEAARPTLDATHTAEELPAVDTAAAIDAAPQPIGRLGRHALVPGRRGAPRDGPGRRRGGRSAVRPRLPLPMLTADDALDNRGRRRPRATARARRSLPENRRPEVAQGPGGVAGRPPGSVPVP